MKMIIKIGNITKIWARSSPIQLLHPIQSDLVNLHITEQFKKPVQICFTRAISKSLKKLGLGSKISHH